MKIKKYKAPTYPLYALSFYRDRKNTLCLTETSNCKDGEIIFGSALSSVLLGSKLAESGLLDDKDKEDLAFLFQSFIKKINEKEVG